MDIYIATKRVRFDTDEIIGVFSDREKAEEAICKYIIDIKIKKEINETAAVFWQCAASWEVDVWQMDIGIKESYGLTETLIAEMVKNMESA